MSATGDPIELAKRFLLPRLNSSTATNPASRTTVAAPVTAAPATAPSKGSGLMGSVLGGVGEGLHLVNEGLGLTQKYLARPIQGALAQGASANNPLSAGIREMANLHTLGPTINDISPIDIPLIGNAHAGELIPAAGTVSQAMDLVTPNNETERQAIANAKSFTDAARENQKTLSPVESIVLDILSDPTTWATAGSAGALEKVPMISMAMERSPLIKTLMENTRVFAEGLDRIQALPITAPVKGLKGVVKVADKVGTSFGAPSLIEKLTELSPASKLVIKSRELDQALRNFISGGGQFLPEKFRGALHIRESASSRAMADTVQTMGDLHSTYKEVLDPITGQSTLSIVPTTTDERNKILDSLNPKQLKHLYTNLGPEDSSYIDVLNYLSDKGLITQTQRTAGIKAAGDIENVQPVFPGPAPTTAVPTPAAPTVPGTPTVPTATVPAVPTATVAGTAVPNAPVTAAASTAMPSRTISRTQFVQQPDGTFQRVTNQVPIPVPTVAATAQTLSPELQQQGDTLLETILRKRTIQSGKNPRLSNGYDAGKMLDGMSLDDLNAMKAGLDPTTHGQVISAIDRSLARNVTTRPGFIGPMRQMNGLAQPFDKPMISSKFPGNRKFPINYPQEARDLVITLDQQYKELAAIDSKIKSSVGVSILGNPIASDAERAALQADYAAKSASIVDHENALKEIHDNYVNGKIQPSTNQEPSLSTESKPRQADGSVVPREIDQPIVDAKFSASTVPGVIDGPHRQRYMNELSAAFATHGAGPDEIKAAHFVSDEMAAAITRRNPLVPDTEAFYSTMKVSAYPGLGEPSFVFPEGTELGTLGVAHMDSFKSAAHPDRLARSVIELYSKSAWDKGPDTVFGTYAHELSHIIENYLNDEDAQTLANIVGASSFHRFTSQQDETIARGYEMYLLGGRGAAAGELANNPFMKTVYEGISRIMKQTLDFITTRSRSGLMKPQMEAFWHDFLRNVPSGPVRTSREQAAFLIRSGAAQTGNVDILNQIDNKLSDRMSRGLVKQFGMFEPLPNTPVQDMTDTFSSINFPDRLPKEYPQGANTIIAQLDNLKADHAYLLDKLNTNALDPVNTSETIYQLGKVNDKIKMATDRLGNYHEDYLYKIGITDQYGIKLNLSPEAALAEHKDAIDSVIRHIRDNENTWERITQTLPERPQVEQERLQKFLDNLDNTINDTYSELQQEFERYQTVAGEVSPYYPEDGNLSAIVHPLENPSTLIAPNRATIPVPRNPQGKLKKSYQDFLGDIEDAANASDTTLLEQLISKAGPGKRRAVFDSLDQQLFQTNNAHMIEDAMVKRGNIERIVPGIDHAPTITTVNGQAVNAFDDAIAKYVPQNATPAANATVNDVLQHTISQLPNHNPVIVPRVEAMIKSVVPTNPTKFQASWMWNTTNTREALQRALTAPDESTARQAVGDMFRSMNMQNSAFGLMHPKMALLLNVLPSTTRTVDNGLPNVLHTGNSIISEAQQQALSEAYARPAIMALQEELEQDVIKVGGVLNKYAGATTLDEYTTARQLNDALIKNIITDVGDKKIVESFLKKYAMTEADAEKIAAKGVKNRVATGTRGLDTFSVQEAFMEKVIEKHFKVQADILKVDLTKNDKVFMKSLAWIPKAWREQALLSPRYHLANVMDMSVKSLIHGVNPIHNMGAKDFAERGLEMTSLPMGVFVHNDTRDLAQIRNIPEFLSAGSETALGQIPGIGVIADPVVRFNRSMARGSENAFRQWAWHNEVKDFLTGYRPQFDSEIRRLMPGADGANLIADLEKQGNAFKRSTGVEFGPNRLREMARQRGASSAAANELESTWKAAIDAASQSGVDMSNKVHFDFEKTYNIEDKLMLRKFLPFHFFATRNLPFYLETFAAHPEVVNAWQAYQDVSEQDRINMGLPSRFKNFIPVGDGFLHGMLGPGQMFFNPSSAISIVDQGKSLDKLTGGTPGQDPVPFWSKQTVGNTLNRLSGASLGVAPWVQIPLSALGFYGPKDETSSVLRLSSPTQSVTAKFGLNNGKGYDLGEERFRHAVDAVRSLPVVGTGQKVVTKSGSAYRDNQIVNRLAELSRENIHAMGVPEASMEARAIRQQFEVAAQEGPTNPLWQEAEKYVRSSANGMAIGAFFNPLPMKVATNEALNISKENSDLPPGFTDFWMSDPAFKRRAEAGGDAIAAYKGYDRPQTVDTLTGKPVYYNPTGAADTFDPTQLGLWNGTIWGPDKEFPYNSYTVMKGYLMWLDKQPQGTSHSPETFINEMNLLGG